ncbi:MAG: hypothetical protein QXH80_03155, partial [Candidatus Nanoarchaeia archaeon]
MTSKKGKEEEKSNSVSDGADDFSFDDVPILGGGKEGKDFSFEEMPETPVPIRRTERSDGNPSVSFLEKILLDNTNEKENLVPAKD